MADSQSSEEGVKRITTESEETRPQRGSVIPFLSNNDHPTSAFVSQTRNTSRTMNIKPNERPELKKKPYPSSLPEKTLASVTQLMDLRKWRKLLRGFYGEVSYPIGTINLSVTIGKPGKLWTIQVEFAVIKSHSPYNGILGRIGLGSLGAVASTIHSMIKFPITNEIATMKTKKENLQECQRMEEAQGMAMKGRTNPRMQASESEGTTSKGKEGSRGQTNKTGESGGIIQPPPVLFEEGAQGDKKVRERTNSLRSRPKVSLRRRSGLIKMLRKHADAFAWTLADMTGIPRFIAEHELKTHHHIEPRVQKKRSIASNRRKVVKDKVTDWLKAEIVRKESKQIKKTKVVVNMPSPSNLKQMKPLSRKLAALNIFLSKAAKRALTYLDTLKKCTNKKDFHWTTEAEEAFQAMKKLIAELPTLTAPKKEEELMVYLSAANEAVSSVLLVERDGRQTSIHYVSRMLQGVKLIYPPMEMLALALVHEALGRLAKWRVELEAYDIKYALRGTIKGQVLVDFLEDTMTEDSPTQVRMIL
nr:hypothetical protein [Tanacetum cinerariifolium]